MLIIPPLSCRIDLARFVRFVLLWLLPAQALLETLLYVQTFPVCSVDSATRPRRCRHLRRCAMRVKKKHPHNRHKQTKTMA